MQAEGLARQSKGPHGLLLRLGEMLRESLQGAAQRTTDIRSDIATVDTACLSHTIYLIMIPTNHYS